MRKYFDTVEDSLTGKPIAGAEVAVLTAPSDEGGTSATLFLSDGITETDNPVSTDEAGYFSFYVADGTYTLEISIAGEIKQAIEGVQIFDESGFGDLDGKLDADAVSAYGLTLIDDANPAAARSTLELGTAAVAATGDFAAPVHDHSAADITSGSLALARGGTGASLSDPGGDRILFWDDSESTTAWLSLGSGLLLSGTTLSATGGGGGGSDTWGAITGTLSDQTDLQAALDAKTTLTASGSLTNKTISLGSNTVSGTTAQFNTALSDGDFATLAGSETLTNKTFNLTSNTLTMTLAQLNTAVSDANMASLAGSETLTNKTIDLASNTVTMTLAQLNTAVSDANMASLAGSETLTNKTIALGSNSVSGSLSDFNSALTGADFVSLAGSETLTNKRVTPRAVSAGGTSGSQAPNGDTTDIFLLTGLTGSTTIAAPTGTPTNGQKLVMRIKDNGTSRSLTWNAIYQAIGVTLPAATTLGKYHYIGCIYNQTDSKWDVVAVQEQA